MAEQKPSQKKNVPKVYMKPLNDEVLEQYMQRTFVIKKGVLTKETHTVQPIHQEVQQDVQNIEEPKEQLEAKEESVEEPKEQLEAKEESVEEPKEQLEAKEESVEEFKEQLEVNEEGVEESKEQLEVNEESVEESKEQLEAKEESVAEFKEQLEAKEERIEEFKEQPETNEEGVMESKAKSEVNEAEKAEELQKNVVSNAQDQGKNGAEVQKSKQKSISFRKMTNEEKVYYLLNRPHYIPKVNCLFRTNQASYTGYITSYDNGIIKINSSTGLIETAININEIIMIQMIGT